MSDEMIAPLMPNSDEQEEDVDNEIEGNEQILEGNYQNLDNENENLLNYRRENENLLNHRRDNENLLNNRRENENLLNNQRENRNNDVIRNIALSQNQKKGLIFLSYSFVLFLYFIILYFFSKYIDIKTNSHIDIIYYLSLVIMTILALIHILITDILGRRPYTDLIIFALVSTISILFIFYKLTLLVKFKYITSFIISIILINLSLWYIYYFHHTMNDIGEISFYVSIFIVVIFLTVIGILMEHDYSTFVDMLFTVFIFDVIFIIHSFYFYNTINNIRIRDYPIYLSLLNIDIFLTWVIYGLLYLLNLTSVSQEMSTKNENNNKGNEDYISIFD